MHSEELFRFVAVRAPRIRRRPINSLSFTELSPFVRTLLNNLRDDQPRALVRETIDGFLEKVADQLRNEEDPVIANLIELHDSVWRERPVARVTALQP